MNEWSRALGGKVFMHCPSCGNESALDQKFCRQCGFDLTPVGALLTQGPREIHITKAERERQILRHMIRWMTRGLIVIGLGILTLFTNKSFDLGKLFALLSTILMLVGTGLAVYSVISAVALNVKLSESEPGKPKERELKKPATTKELSEGHPVPAPSVTERTTQLIDNRPQRPQ